MFLKLKETMFALYPYFLKRWRDTVGIYNTPILNTPEKKNMFIHIPPEAVKVTDHAYAKKSITY